MSKKKRVAFTQWLRDGNRVPLDTIHAFVYPSLGAFDVFMYVSCRTKLDVQICKAYTPQVVGNRMFCAGGLDRDVTYADMGLDEVKFMQAKNHFKEIKETGWQNFLKQLRDYTKCNIMIRNAEAAEGIWYKYIVRLRPDLAFFSSIPHISNFKLSQDTIAIRSSLDGGPGGSADQVNVGRPQIMHHFLDRFYDFGKLTLQGKLYAEHFTHAWLEQVYGGSFVETPGLHYHPWRYAHTQEVKGLQNYSSKLYPNLFLNSADCHRD
eukprot:gnl/MRDRNA2_/MRDRNA2_247025_c0_seq1.p1 gnl/MRDRNA2_/MRDRNA2_247025_c0~~gnl/MRDRNA2_/MRDRNA2_247025_c0_seq1.p1  ORF type:complete len:305 (+),score=41.84 gnl/MRDRNA2_/MRDRNA2_247025_c0_seq1:124-915(+)